jgi:hypothetical protein
MGTVLYGTLPQKCLLTTRMANKGKREVTRGFQYDVQTKASAYPTYI